MTLEAYESTRHPATLVDLLRLRAGHRPDRLAYTFLSDGDTREAHLTYAELDRQARAIGAVLQSLDAAGERVLLAYPPGLDFIAAFFGCLYAGAVPVPVYPPDPARPERTLRRLLAIVEDARPCLGLTTMPMLSVAGSWPGDKNLRWLATSRVTPALAESWRDPGASGETLAFLQYTSGSTATPKGVMITHDNVMQNERMIQRAMQIGEEGMLLGWLPMYHDMGLIGVLLQPLYAGCRCVLMSPLDFLQKPVRWLEAITRYRPTVSGGPNFAYDLCVRKITADRRMGLDLSSWEVAFCGAEPVRYETWQRFAAAFAPCGFRSSAFYPCYGLAEATLLVTGGLQTAAPVAQTVVRKELEHGKASAAGGSEAQVLMSSGRQWLQERVAIVDPETDMPVAPGHVGEVWVSGPNVAQGYWNRPEESERTFRARLAGEPGQAFLRTGDLGFLAAGELFITGRIKDLIIIDGRNLYPQDIELTVEQSHPALRLGCCAAFGVDDSGQERLVIAAEIDRAWSEAGTAADSDEILVAVRQAVTRYHDVQVHEVVLLRSGTIPKTSSGKIQRHACRAGYLDGMLEELGVRHDA